MNSNKWSIGAKIWFGLMILGNWLMFIEYATKPITRTNRSYQEATLIYGIFGVIGTALYLWLAISKKKSSLITILLINGFNTASLLLQGNIVYALLSLISPIVTFMIAREKVGLKKKT